MAVLDTSSVADDSSPGMVISLNNELITSLENSLVWVTPLPCCL